MSVLKHTSPLEERKYGSQRAYFLDSMLGSVGSLLVTLIIATFHLYPRIPNISIIYLLVVLVLASTRSRYAAVVASVVAFLSFDFFIVPPLYTFVMYHVEEWISLFVFLVNALLIGHLAAALRLQASRATQRERETHLLYDLVRLTNREEEPAQQLQAIARAIADVFSSWGVRDCAILQPNQAGTVQIQASAYFPLDQTHLSTEEQASASWVMEHGQGIKIENDSLVPTSSTYAVQRVLTDAEGQSLRHVLRLLPLKLGTQVVGVLRLEMLEGPHKGRQEEEYTHTEGTMTFFWTFLDQAATLIERARLRSENLRIQVLQRTDALRAALLSSVSHDLRTPLTIIKAAASSLLQTVQWTEEERHSFLHSIEREADRLNRLVENLLDMSRIEEGALKPEKEWFQLTTLVQDVVDRLQPLLQGRVVQLHLPQTLPPVALDYLQIDQVLTNLIENAVRYTSPDSPIEMSARHDGNEVCLCISDHGPGIPADELEHIFDKFYRVLKRKHYLSIGGAATGSGLGLSVCRGLVEAHGGRIWAEPREGGGMTFFVVLPAGALEGSLL